MNSKKILFSLALGLLVLYTVQIVASVIWFIYLQSQISNITVNDFESLPSKLSTGYIGSFINIFKLFGFVLAGFIVSLRLKQKGWLFGGLLGGIWFILILVLPMLLSARELTLSFYPQYLTVILMFLLKIVGLTALGGLLGDYFRKRK